MGEKRYTTGHLLHSSHPLWWRLGYAWCAWACGVAFGPHSADDPPLCRLVLEPGGDPFEWLGKSGALKSLSLRSFK